MWCVSGEEGGVTARLVAGEFLTRVPTTSLGEVTGRLVAGEFLRGCQPPP